MTPLLDEDDVFEILASSRRRAIIRALSDADVDECSVPTLIDRVVERERETRPADELPAHLRSSVYNTTVQNHLPRLDSAGVVLFEDTNSPVRRGPSFEVTARVLAAAAATFEQGGGQ